MDDERSTKNHEPALIPEVLERADVESGTWETPASEQARQSGPQYTFSQGRIKVWSCSPGCILFALILCALMGVAIIWKI